MSRMTTTMKIPACFLLPPSSPEAHRWIHERLPGVDSQNFLVDLCEWIQENDEEPLVLIAEDGAWKFVGSPVPHRPVEYIRFSVSVQA